ncbi:hypothetical protein RKD27_000022 [Streptomyces sp. SAI-126]|nr:hypothetical protein [Streptomyces sp. SAI-149]
MRQAAYSGGRSCSPPAAENQSIPGISQSYIEQRRSSAASPAATRTGNSYGCDRGAELDPLRSGGTGVH